MDVLSLSIEEYASYLEKHHEITVIPPDIDKTQENRMLAGQIHDCMSPCLLLGRQRANDIVTVLNSNNNDTLKDSTTELDAGTRRARQYQKELRQREALLHLLTNGNLGPGCKVEPPLKVDYGKNIILQDNITIKPNVVILDCSLIKIGSRTVLENGVQIYSATHPINPLLRNVKYKFDYAIPVSIGNDCWIGPRAVICPGVCIGDRVVVEPGSVVTKNVPSNVVVAGSPAKVVRVLDAEDCERENQEFESKGQGQGHEFGSDWMPEPVGTLEML
ncbi:hypothetical protein BGZ46_007326 [Entomortierella lignicola]|nr:hypothetical protein BGZ46_007326 [Entomortierella lignicola]